MSKGPFMKKMAILPAIFLLLSFSLSAELIAEGNSKNSVSLLIDNESETILEYRIGEFEKNMIL